MQELLTGTSLVDVAVERLRLNEPPKGEGYFLAFSGGKDSEAIYRLAELAGVKFDAHRNVVPFEPPELGRFIRRHYPDVQWDRAEESFESMLLKKMFPPLRTQRWCCELLKERAGEDRIVVTGVRWAESRHRAKRKVLEACYKKKSKWYLNPIIDWTTADVWAFLEEQGLPHCSLYDPPPAGGGRGGRKRIGCLMCPCATRDARAKDALDYPRSRRWLVRLFQKLVDVRIERGKPFTKWRTGEELFAWWIADKRRGPPDAEGQGMIFE